MKIFRVLGRNIVGNKIYHRTTIPSEIIEKLGWDNTKFISFEDVDDSIIIKKVDIANERFDYSKES